MERIRVLATHLKPQGGLKRIILFRHAEREDHIRPEWSGESLRPHDPPLSKVGRKQAVELGERLKAAYPHLNKDNTVVFSSPFVRTVMTMDGVMKGLFSPDAANHPSIKLEQLFSEKGKNVHRRMRGLHHTSFNKDHTREVCNPILLGPGDLMSITLSIDAEYTTTTKLIYDSTGMEVTADGRISTIDDRLEEGISPFISQFNSPGPTTALIATHGGVSRHIAQALTGQHMHYRPGYCHAHVLELDENGKWRIVYSWLPASSSVRDGNKQSIPDWQNPWPEKQ